MNFPANAFAAVGCQHRLLAHDLGWDNAVQRPCNAPWAPGSPGPAGRHLDSNKPNRSKAPSERHLGNMSPRRGFSHFDPVSIDMSLRLELRSSRGSSNELPCGRFCRHGLPTSTPGVRPRVRQRSSSPPATRPGRLACSESGRTQARCSLPSNGGEGRPGKAAESMQALGSPGPAGRHLDSNKPIRSKAPSERHLGNMSPRRGFSHFDPVSIDMSLPRELRRRPRWPSNELPCGRFCRNGLSTSTPGLRPRIWQRGSSALQRALGAWLSRPSGPTSG